MDAYIICNYSLRRQRAFHLTTAETKNNNIAHTGEKNVFLYVEKKEEQHGEKQTRETNNTKTRRKGAEGGGQKRR